MATITPTTRVDASFFGSKPNSDNKTTPVSTPAPATQAAATAPVAKRKESVLSSVQKNETNIKVICSLLKTLSPVVGGNIDRITERVDISEAIVAKTIEKLGVKGEDEITKLMPTLLPTVVNMVARGNLTMESVDRVATGLAYAGAKIPAGARIEKYTASDIDAIELRRSAMVSIMPVIAEMGSFRFSSHEKDDLEMAVKHIIAGVMHHLPNLAPDGVGELSTVILAQSIMNNFGVILAGAWRKNTFDALDMVDEIVLSKKIPLSEAMDQVRAHCDWSRKIKEDFNTMSEKLIFLTKEIIVLDFKKPTRVSTKIRRATGTAP